MISPHYGYLNRGAETFTREITKVLKKKGHTVDIYAMGEKQEDLIHTNGLRIDKGIGKIWRDIVDRSKFGGFSRKYIGYEPCISHISYILSLQKTFKQNTYDYLWNNGEMFGALFCKKIKQQYNTPTVCTFHGNESKMMIREAQLNPEVFAVLTPQYKTYLKNKIKTDVSCIPNGIDLKTFNPNIKPLQKYGIEKLEKPLFLSTSALSSVKRVDLIINAISQLKKGSLIFTQNGPEKNKLIDLAEKKLKKRHLYLGIIPYEELPSLYSTCDVYINASRSEGHSLALLEALACNLPIVTTKDETRKWSLENAAILTDVTNIKTFKESIQKAINKKWNDIPRKQAEKFSWEKTVNTYLRKMEKTTT